jgi:hypothetical protein
MPQGERLPGTPTINLDDTAEGREDVRVVEHSLTF